MIFYFSGTGNTLWAARRISEAIGEQLIPMTSAGPEAQGFELSDDERIGFCFPVHGWRPPALVRDFVRRISVPHPGNRLRRTSQPGPSRPVCPDRKSVQGRGCAEGTQERRSRDPVPSRFHREGEAVL